MFKDPLSHETLTRKSLAQQIMDVVFSVWDMGGDIEFICKQTVFKKLDHVL